MLEQLKKYGKKEKKSTSGYGDWDYGEESRNYKQAGLARPH